MSMENNILQSLYVKGFVDQKNNEPMIDWFKDDVSKKAYMLGRLYASYDMDTPFQNIDNWEIILEEIKKL